MFDRENYYSFKIKVLFELKEYEKCISICDKALAHMKNFHHENDLWFKVKKAKCLSALNNNDKA